MTLADMDDIHDTPQTQSTDTEHRAQTHHRHRDTTDTPQTQRHRDPTDTEAQTQSTEHRHTTDTEHRDTTDTEHRDPTDTEHRDTTDTEHRDTPEEPRRASGRRLTWPHRVLAGHRGGQCRGSFGLRNGCWSWRP